MRADRQCPSVIEGDRSKPSFIASILVSAGYDSLGLSCKRKVLGFPLELWLTSAICSCLACIRRGTECVYMRRAEAIEYVYNHSFIRITLLPLYRPRQSPVMGHHIQFPSNVLMPSQRLNTAIAYPSSKRPSKTKTSVSAPEE